MNAKYPITGEVKTEPLEKDHSSDVLKSNDLQINQIKKRVCDGCEKTYNSRQSVWNTKRFVV